MGVLNLSLYRHPSGVAFDPRKVLAKAREWFPEATFLPGDPSAAEVQRAEAFFAEELEDDPAGPAGKVLASLRRKAQSYGPGLAFTIPLPSGDPVRGLARSVGVEFLFTPPLADDVRRRLIDFLKALGVGRLEASTEDARQFEVLADLHGPSDYLQDRPGAPWPQPGSPGPTETAEAP